MNLDSLHPDQVEAVFEQHGAVAVTLSDAGDNPVLEPGPGETPLWNETRITGLFHADTDFSPLKADILASFGIQRLPDHRVEDLPDREWEREWLNDFQPIRFGQRLWVSPHGAEGDFENDIVIRLDPGLAFGTGTHATTALCLEWLESLDLHHARVLDFGCGSGILGIGALLLGADSVVATDIDPQAITATENNAAANGVSGRLTATVDSHNCGTDFDVVVANILAGPLVDLAPTLSTRIITGGVIALSGILEDQSHGVRSAYEPWFAIEAPVIDSGWVRLQGTRR